MTQFSRLVLSTTNVVAILPLSILFASEDYATFGILIVTTLLSYFSHILEGNKDFEQFYKILNKGDLFMCWVFLIRFLYIVNLQHIDFISVFTILTFNIISIMGKIYKSNYIYTLYHGLWHISIFVWLYHQLLIVYP